MILSPAHSAPSIWTAADLADSRRPRSRQTRLGASDTVCERRAAYILHGHPRTDHVVSPAAILGTYIHAGLTAAAKQEFGWLVERKVADTAVSGSVDIVQLDGATARKLPTRLRPKAPADAVTVEDIKTKTVWKWDDVLRYEATEAELRQVHLYADLVRTQGFEDRDGQRVLARLGPVDVRQIRLRFICRDNGEEHVQEIDFDPQRAEEARWWLDRVAETKSPEDGRRDFNGPGLDTVCDFCPFASACWGLPAPGRPVQTTLIHDDKDVEQALVDYVEAHGPFSASKRVKDLVRKMVDASAEGRYGPNVLKWSGGNPVEKPDLAKMIEQFDDAGLAIPQMPDEAKMVKILTAAGLAVPMRETSRRSPRTIRIVPFRE
ncbi:PD-(D/E)XK nuclease family protein [Kitasatospora sp. NPDC002227]|uniref:PD-(D/E)XK nuclease family protein n=1 Tax=Kitasatospora sp. NPDC002227 TaxID=3154773 RepID=UPI0033199C9C